MSVQRDKAQRWLRRALSVILLVAGIRFLRSFSAADPEKARYETFLLIFSGILFFGPAAYLLGLASSALEARRRSEPSGRLRVAASAAPPPTVETPTDTAATHGAVTGGSVSAHGRPARSPGTPHTGSLEPSVLAGPDSGTHALPRTAPATEPALGASGLVTDPENRRPHRRLEGTTGCLILAGAMLVGVPGTYFLTRRQLHPPKDPSPPQHDLSRTAERAHRLRAEEIEASTGTLRLYGESGLARAEIFNGTARELTHVTIEIAVLTPDGAVARTSRCRLLRTVGDGSRLTQSEFSATCGIRLSGKETFQWNITELETDPEGFVKQTKQRANQSPFPIR